jgi:hypothetical protein
MLALLASAGGCGARTAAGSDPPAPPSDAGQGRDAGRDAGRRSAPDASPLDAGECPWALLAASPMELVLALDASESMHQPVERTRWQMLAAGLRDALPVLREAGPLGAKVFPALDRGELCALDPTLDVPLAEGSDAAVDALLDRLPAGTGTPIAEAVRTAEHALLDRGAVGTIVLVTDGQPTCPRGGRDGPLERTVRTIAVARLNGIETVVIGIATAPEQHEILDAFALEGGRAQLDGAHRYYAAEDAAQVTAILTSIARELPRCVRGAAPMGLRRVRVGGVELARDDEDGWSWRSQQSGVIGLHGEACARASRGEAVEIQLACRR